MCNQQDNKIRQMNTFKFKKIKQTLSYPVKLNKMKMKNNYRKRSFEGKQVALFFIKNTYLGVTVNIRRVENPQLPTYSQKFLMVNRATIILFCKLVFTYFTYLVHLVSKKYSSLTNPALQFFGSSNTPAPSARASFTTIYYHKNTYCKYCNGTYLTIDMKKKIEFYLTPCAHSRLNTSTPVIQ